LQFNLKRLLPEQISQQMAFILQQERIAFDNEALILLARAADGSMRDGLSLVDQAIAYGQGRVNTVDVSAMLGTVAQQPVDNLLRALQRQDGKEMLAVIAEIAQLTPDFTAVLQQLLRVLHRVALLQTIPEFVDHEFDAQLLTELATHLLPEDVQLYYQIGLLGQKDLDLAPDPRTGFEMVMLRMLAFRPVQSVGKTAPRQSINTVQTTSAPTAPLVNNPPVLPAAYPPISPVAADNHQWSQIIMAMNLSGLTKQLANNCALESIDNNNCHLLIDPNYSAGGTKAKENLQIALQNYLRNPSLKLIFKAQTNAYVTPAIQQQQQRDDRQQAAVDAIQNDPNVRGLQEHFNASVIPNTIKPL
jgi:DNA polymerase-3 subunit gamma/tau